MGVAIQHGNALLDCRLCQTEDYSPYGRGSMSFV
jgi:hypothetical protein